MRNYIVIQKVPSITARSTGPKHHHQSFSTIGASALKPCYSGQGTCAPSLREPQTTDRQHSPRETRQLPCIQTQSGRRASTAVGRSWNQTMPTPLHTRETPPFPATPIAWLPWHRLQKSHGERTILPLTFSCTRRQKHPLTGTGALDNPGRSSCHTTYPWYTQCASLTRHTPLIIKRAYSCLKRCRHLMTACYRLQSFFYFCYKISCASHRDFVQFIDIAGICM